MNPYDEGDEIVSKFQEGFLSGFLNKILKIAEERNMKDGDTGIDLTEKEIIKEAMNHLSEACCFLFEVESLEGRSLAFMADAVLKLAQVIYRDDDPLMAAADYTAYEEDHSFKGKHIRVIK